MIYLDNAATSFPKPAAVLRAVTDAVTLYGGNPGRGGCPPASLTAERVYDCRESINSFFNGYGAEHTVFTSNATAALNAAIFGTAKRTDCKGHFVITAFEHNSVLRPVEELRRSCNMEYTVVAPSLVDDAVTVTRIMNAVRENTVAVIMTHASNVCGRILPVETVGKRLKNSGITFIVDASQSAGCERVDMQGMNISILCTAGHKGLMGPAGTGLMLLDPNQLPLPTVFGGTGSNSAERVQPLSSPERFESGTLNTVGIIGLKAGLDVLRESPDAPSREKALARLLYTGLRSIPDVKLYARFIPELFVPTVMFNLNSKDSYSASDALCRMGFAIRGGLHCAPLAHKYFGTSDTGTLRASIGYYNTSRDIYGFLEAVEKIAKKFK